MIPPRVVLLVRNLGRDNPNEVITTVRAINAALRSQNLDFHDLAEALEGSRASAPLHAGRMPTFGDMARACRDLDCGRLTPRERGFVQQMCARGFAFQPTSPQNAWLLSIFGRLQSSAAA